MIKLEGIKLSSIGTKLEYVGDLLYHEGPLLSHFISNNEEHYLYKWCDSDDICNRWMVFKVSKNNMILFFTKEISLLKLIYKNKAVFFIDLDNDAVQQGLILTNVKNIPKEYLPTNNSYYDEVCYEQYAKKFKSKLLKLNINL